MNVAVELWKMDSDSGYVQSSGHAAVHLVPAERATDLAAAAGAGTRSLYNFAGAFPKLEKSKVTESEPYERRSGALSYRGVTGIYQVEDGVIPVQVSVENICTRDDVIIRATVLGEDTAVTLYKERAEHYAALASKVGGD